MFAIRTRVSCSVALKLTVVVGGTKGQVIAGLTSPVLWFTESYPFISAFSLADDSHFLSIVPLIRCHPTFEFKPIIIILSCSSNMVAEGIGGQASGAIARRRQVTLLV